MKYTYWILLGVGAWLYVIASSDDESSARTRPQYSYMPPPATMKQETQEAAPSPVNSGRETVMHVPTFHGARCTVDCSGHEAGYSWAESHDIDDPDDCGGNSESFIEGCQSYAEERQAALNVEEGSHAMEDDEE